MYSTNCNSHRDVAAADEYQGELVSQQYNHDSQVTPAIAVSQEQEEEENLQSTSAAETEATAHTSM